MFLTVMTVAEALDGARAGAAQRGRRRSPPALGVVPAERRASRTSGCPAWARATVDGYAVRAADTYAARRDAAGVPGGHRRGGDGPRARGRGRPGRGDGDPDRRAAPARRRRRRDGRAHDRADARPRRAAARRRAGRRRAAAGRGGDAGRRAGAGRPAAARRRPRAARLGGRHRARRARAPARRDRLDRRRGRAGATRATPAPGQVRDACAPALAGLVREAGGEPVLRGIVPDDAAALERVLGESVAEDDVVVVSAGSSVGARDLTATVVARLGEVVCHGLAIKPGKPTLLADCGGVPLIGLPGNPRSALVVFRLVGVPLVRTVARDHGAAAGADRARARWRATSRAPRGGSTSSRRRCDDGIATPRFGSSALLGPMVARRRLVPRARARHRARRRHRGRRRALRLTRHAVPCRDAPFLSDIPAAEALAAWLAARAGAARRRRARAGGRARPRDRRAGLGAALLARLRRRGDGRDRACARADTFGATETAPRTVPSVRRRRHRRRAARGLRRRRHARAAALGGRRAGGPRRRGAVAARAHDRRGRQRDRAAAARGPPAAAGRPRGRRRGRAHVAARSGARRTSS